MVSKKPTPFIQEILALNEIDGHYVEPYAGGAGVTLQLLSSAKVKNTHLNDSDIKLYAFWYSVINENERLCRKIISASLTIDEWKNEEKF